MSYCSIGACAPAVVSASAVRVGKQSNMLAAARRVRFAHGSRVGNAAVAFTGSRPAAVPVSLITSAVGSAWTRSLSGRRSQSVFSSAVAEPDAADAPAPEPIKLLTSDESEELLKIRHTTAHICAMATQKLFPDAQCTIGPW
tara:strand:- start:14110 stop:14535 length:426 start_codon:yes stop_codon:yes gene_type:complete